jgi:hypothetical protein
MGIDKDKFVKIGKFYPKITLRLQSTARNTYLIFRLSINKAIIARKKTTIPMYAGAATIG